jgi:hypothetical protein
MNTLPCLIGWMCLLAGDGASATLRGMVVDAAGKPIAGARVSIATAAPRFGPGVRCPSCYRDCARWTRADDQGRFEIPGLDPALRFTVLATSPSKKACRTQFVDPLSDKPKLVLETLPAFPPDRTVSAQVIDDRGQPIAGALIDPVGARKNEGRLGGTVKGLEPTVTDGDGCFRVLVPPEYLAVDLEVSPYGYAGARAADLKPGSERQRIVVPAGARVRGRLVYSGRPMPGLRVAVVQMDRRSDHHFIKAVGDMTDAAGRFSCDHLPANEDYAVFTLVGEGPQALVLTTKRFRAPGDHQERDLGDLAVIPAQRLAGRLEAPAGQSVPRDTRVVLIRDPAWDLIAVPVEKDGRFVIEGLPPETYHVEVVAKGFEIDGSRLSYQLLGPRAFGLHFRESVEDLRIPLAPARAAAVK